jgi:Skp family chaperone for outer membrane proteins
MRKSALPRLSSSLTLALVAIVSALAATAYAARTSGATVLTATAASHSKGAKALTPKKVEALITKRLKSVTAGVTALQRENAALKSAVATLQGKLTAAGTTAGEVATLKSQLAALQAQLAAAGTSALTSEVSTLKGHVTALSNEAAALTSTDEELSGEVSALQGTLADVSFNPSGPGGRPALTLSGANLQIINGQGHTASANGVGNLIVGYDEGAGAQTGSHDIVLGENQTSTSYGGLLAGVSNVISGPFSVAFGDANTASGSGSSVTGGGGNTASGEASTVAGGNNNAASGQTSSVLGGGANEATGHSASVSGGNNNKAAGITSAILGGALNHASGQSSTVGGGLLNLPEALLSSILGGRENAIANKAENEAFTILGGFQQAGTLSKCATLPATNHC